MNGTDTMGILKDCDINEFYVVLINVSVDQTYKLII